MSPTADDCPVACTKSLEYASLLSQVSHLRGVRWRIYLCNLPSSSVVDLRRVTADSRRRYAVLRKRLLVDPHIPKDGSTYPNLVMDNPLSENPDSMWGRFFRNAELEKLLDQDLSRLYPEHGSYFQTLGCQSMLRRILLLWCLRHPEYGYRQGMHELLAPLLYVIHADLQQLSEACKLHEDHFTDKFDDEQSELAYDFDFRRCSDFIENDASFEEKLKKSLNLDELDPEIKTIVLLSDPYGAEGELGVVLSEKFMEHDVYCMFDALMSGADGAVAMAEFFSPSAALGTQTGLSPVMEASSTLYHLLSLVDSPFYSHLIELGVEPQYFGLRWLRVLFGREFPLEGLLVIWDEIFSYDNGKLDTCGEDGAWVVNSHRGAFICAMGVSMMLNLRSSLLAMETATSCLERLLNFPRNIDLGKVIEKAKSLLPHALDTITSSSYASSRSSDQIKRSVVRGHSLSFDSASSTIPLISAPERYWEEKWRDLHKEEEVKEKERSIPIRGWTEKIKSRLYRTESEPPIGTSKQSSCVRRSLLEDLSKHLGENTMEDAKDNSSIHSEAASPVSGSSSLENDLYEMGRPHSPESEDRKSYSGKENLICSIRKVGQSMLHNIQVIELAFHHQDKGEAGSKGQVTTMSALKELRKISNLLSEM